MKTSRTLWLLAVVPVVVAACNASPTNPTRWADPTTIEYYPGLHVNLARMTRTASGVFYWDSIPGTGTVPADSGDRVVVDYQVWLPDGTPVEIGSNTTLSLVAGTIIPGMIDGLEGAVQGTTRQLVVPPAEAWGLYGSSRVPPNATVVFLVTIDAVTPAASGSVALPGDSPGETSPVAAPPPAGPPAALTAALAAVLSAGTSASR